jgi:hypothetical protein
MRAYFHPFHPLIICIFFIYNVKFPMDRYRYHTTILIFNPKLHVCALKAYFQHFDTQKYIFSCFVYHISHDHTNFGAQISFLASKGLFSPFQLLKAYIFFIYIKFPIDEYITRPYWFWNLKTLQKERRKVAKAAL